MYDGKKLCHLVQDTKYSITQTNGQRVYGLRTSSHDEPPRSSELFIGKLPRDIFEDELVPIFEQIGPIYELRLMVNFDGTNRGYCFVRYFTREHAERAIRCLNYYEVRPGCRLGVYWSLDNTRLFVGGLPRDKTKTEIVHMLEYYMDNIKNIIMYPSYDDITYNRGYAFLEFENHRAAAIARRRIPPGSHIWNSPIKVDWADPVPEPPSEIMSKVATLYMRSIPSFMSTQEFERLLLLTVKPELITKVYKTLDYAFVHFINREVAEKCLHDLQYFKILQKKIEVTWARPQRFSRKYNRNTTPDHYCMSLPARSRWLIRKKSNKNGGSSERSSDCADYNSESSRVNTPLFIFPRDQHILEEYARELGDTPSSSNLNF